MHLTISRNDCGARPKFHWFQSSSIKLPTPITSLQSIPLPLLDLIEDSDAVVFRGCTLWCQHVGVDGLFSGRDQHLEALIYHGVKVVILLSFQYDGHDLLISGNDLVFRRFHTSGHLMECFIRFYKFQSSCFAYRK